jgi:hypothetical protein
MADQVIITEPELNLCVFVEFCSDLINIKNFWLYFCIHATVILWRMDFEHSLWYYEQFVFYVTLLMKYHCHFVLSLSLV